MSWDPKTPLARMKGEQAKANQALWDYAQMGEGRSLAKLIDLYQAEPKASPASRVRAEPPTTRLATLKAWSARYAWQDRLEAWRQIERAREAVIWEERRDSFRELIFKVAEKSIDRVQSMIDYPLTRRVVLERDEDGREVVIQIEPANWNMAATAKLLAEANKAGRLALGESTENYDQRQSGSLSIGGYPDLDHMEDAELNDLIQRTLDRLSAPGPSELRAPEFSGRPEKETGGDRLPPAGKGQADGNA